MKKTINLLFTTFIAVAFFSCNSPDENDRTEKDKSTIPENHRLVAKSSKYKLELMGVKEFLKLGGKSLREDTVWQHKDKINILSANNNYVHRDGLELEIQGESKNITFKSASDTSEGEGDYYYIIGEEPCINSFIIRYFTIENFFTIIVDKKSCDTSIIDGEAYFSQDRQQIFTVKNFELYDCKGTVYHRKGTKFAASFSFPLNNLLTIETVRWINKKEVIFKMWDNTDQKTQLYKYYKLTIF